MSLSSTDAYVLSRIDGATLAHEIVDACGLDAGTVTEILNRLTAMGLIRWDSQPPKDAGTPSGQPAKRVSGTRVRTKRNIVSIQPPAPGLLERFEGLTHYQLLGLYSDCPQDDVERGHVRARDLEEGTLAFRLAKRLGTRRVLRRVAEAYEVLGSPQTRQKYDEYLLYREETRAIEDALSEGLRRASLVPPPARTSAPAVRASQRGILGEGLNAPPHAPEDKIAEYYLIAALREHLPSGARRSRAERLVSSAIAERDSDNLVGATNALRLASSIAPECDALDTALARIAEEMNKSLASTFRAQAMYEENLQMWEDAAKTWEKVLLAHPDDARAARGVAEALLAAGGDLKRARRRASDAVKNAPEDAECHRTLARVYIAAGMTKSAQSAFDMADRCEAKEHQPRGLLRRARARWSRD